MDNKNRGLKATCQFILFILLWLSPALLWLSPSLCRAASPAGYSEYFIPGPEDQLIIFHNAVNNTAFTTTHSVINVVAWSPATVVYYDHWENGYTFDPTNPEKTGCTGPGGHCYDEKVTLAARGSSHTFESATIPTNPRNPANIFYDGKDRIYAVGGALAVNRVTWPSDAGTVEAIETEVYPVRPQLTTYIMPVGENMAYGTIANSDFERVMAFVQATDNGTTVQFDLNGDGVLGDAVCPSRTYNPCTGGTVTTVSLKAGESFLLDRYASSPTTGDPTTAGTPRILTGTMIKGNKTLQVNYFFCDMGTNYNSRGISAFPTGLWDTQYYAPVGSDTGANNPTDIYLYNPWNYAITITYQNLTTTNSFSVAANSTQSYRVATGGYAAQNSATFLRGTDVFWGFYSIDRGRADYDWSDSLIPAKLLTDEYYIGWAPGAYETPPTPIPAGDYHDSGIFLTAAKDNTRVFVDTNNDGTVDQTYNLNRLQSQFVYDTADGDMSGAHIYATGPIAMTYGENPDNAPTGLPGIDTGAAVVPGLEFEDLVLSVDKATNPVMVSTASGSQTTYTLTANSAKYSVDNVTVMDILPAGWKFVRGTAHITLADMTTSTADPNIISADNRTITWSTSILRTLAENQQITIVFTAQTTQTFTAGDITRNFVEARGYRTIGDPQITQQFIASDFVFNTFSDTSSQMQVLKTSSAVDPLTPGQTFTYTVKVPNSGSSTITNVSIYDPLPDGLSYVASSSQMYTQQADNVRDTFSTAAYTNQNGTANWSADWTETDSVGGGATGGLVSITGNQLQFAPAYSANTRTVLDQFGSASYSLNNGTENWSDSWTETDIPEYSGGASDGDVWITGGTLRLTYVASNVADLFTTNVYTRNDGTLNWSNNWTETGDDGAAGTGTITVDAGNNNRVNFGPGAAGRSIQRTAPVSGTDVTISFTLSDQGIDAGEGVIAEFSLNGGSSWTEMQRITNNTLTGTNPYTTSTAGATSIIIRFRTFGTWSDGDDNAGVDTVNIAYLAAGSQIVRTANLSGANSATLTFDFNRANLETTDTMAVEVNGGSGWNTLATYNSATTVGAKTFDLSSYISSAMQIRFRVTNQLNATNEYFSFDNVQITFNSLVSANGAAISRTASIAGANSAILSFDFSRSGLGAGDTMAVQVNGTTIASFDGTTAIEAKSYDITGYAATPTTVRFVVTGGVSTAGTYFAIDNVDISYVIPGTAVAAHDTPNFVVAADAVSLGVRQTLVLTFNVTVNSPLGTGINSITNNACATATSFVVSVCDDVTNIVSKPSTGAAEVGDLVWLDADRDGLKDVTENGLSNVEVTLKDKYGTPVAVTTTDGNGLYRFTGVKPGTGYYVQVTGGLPPGLVQSAPAGHSDNRTDTFTLTAGQVYLDADLGFKPPAGSGTIGDYVWHDFDGDQVQDAGEPGLAGVTVQLYLDNGNGVFEPGSDTLVRSTVTDVGGHYLFTGVTASGTQDYFVYVDATQASLTGYVPTTVSATKDFDLAAGDVRMANDFGFQNTSTFTYRDRVWFDTNKDKEDDNETGIAGVTIDLLDASLNVIATTATAADGTFQFVGLSGSTFYTVRITDSNSKLLTDYYGTTPEAVAGEFLINHLAANVDYTAEPAEPHFGYNVKGAIGDTVYNDVNNNGVQDAGEPGISGVTVSLYTDTNGNGLLNTGEPLAATLVTDANGNYIFSGLADGNYIVSIASPPSGFTYTSEGPGGDNDPAAGDQQAASISGGSSILTKDFGYHASANRSVSGTIWKDANGDGIIDTGESRLQNVTLDLLHDNGTLIATATTDSSGNYSFAGLPSGSYVVRVTDKNSVLIGYTATYEFTEKTSGPFNGQESVDLSSGNKSGINFGYKDPIPTRAVIAEFGAFNDGGKVVVRWQTLSEQGTIGFYLFRLNEKTGGYKMISDKLLPGFLHSPAGGWYSYEDTTAKIGMDYTYRLEEVEVGGRRISYGPWTVSTGTPLAAENPVLQLKANAFVSGFKQAAKPVSDKTKERREVRREALLKAPSVQPATTVTQAKISLTEDGLYFVTADSIAQVLNRKRNEVVQLIRAGKIRLRNMGRSIAVLPSSGNQGLYFYGEKLETRYTDDNVYWLDVDTAVKMSTVNRAPKHPAGKGQYFQQFVREEENNYPVEMLFTDPTADYWMWDYIFPGYGRDQVSVSVSTPGIVDNDTATLTVALQGASEAFNGNDHHAIISVNGVEVGETRWDGITAATISCQVNTEILNDGENTVVITGKQDPGVPYDLFYLNYVTIAYPRQYTALDNHLAAESNGYDTVVIDGFTDPDIRVFDIADPLLPKLVWGAEIKKDEDNAAEYQVGFRADNQEGRSRAGNQQGRYLAVTPAAIKSCTLVADHPSSLSKKSSRANYLIITSCDLMDAAQELADYRASKGYVTMVVDVEDIYDEFAYGIRDAEAIRTFLRFAYSNWRMPPKYVLLAGEGSFDYKDNMGYGDCLIPPLVAATPEGLIVTDNLYADATGNDLIPEISLGRIPVISAEEFSDYTAKVIGFESAAGAWTSQALLAADSPDAGGNFPGSSDNVSKLFPASFTLEKIYLNEAPYLDAVPPTEARADFLAGINEGRAYVNFTGHGGMTLLGNTNLFSVDDIAQLHNGSHLPVLTAMTCLAGNYGYPGMDSLSEAMVIKENGGAVAMWSPSGFGLNYYSVKLCTGFYAAVFNSGQKTLGDAIRSSLKSYAASEDQLYYLNLYNLMGDPALVIK